MAKYLQCSHGDYQTGTIENWNDIGSPYGLPNGLIPKCIEDHEQAFKGHKVKIIDTRKK